MTGIATLRFVFSIVIYYCGLLRRELARESLFKDDTGGKDFKENFI